MYLCHIRSHARHRAHSSPSVAWGILLSWQPADVGGTRGGSSVWRAAPHTHTHTHTQTQTQTHMHRSLIPVLVRIIGDARPEDTGAGPAAAAALSCTPDGTAAHACTPWPVLRERRKQASCMAHERCSLKLQRRVCVCVGVCVWVCVEAADLNNSMIVAIKTIWGKEETAFKGIRFDDTSTFKEVIYRCISSPAFNVQRQRQTGINKQKAKGFQQE